MLSTATRNSTACFNKRLVGLKAVTSHKLSCALNLQGRRTGGAAPELARPPGDFSRTAPASLGTKLQRARRERRHRRTFGHHLWETSRVWEESRQPRPHGGAAPSLRGLLHPAGCRFQTLPATSQPGSELSEGPGQPVPPARAAGPGRAGPPVPSGPERVPCRLRSPPGPAGACAGSAACDRAGLAADTGALSAGHGKAGASPPGDRHGLGRPRTGSSGPRCRPTHLRRLRLGLARPELSGLEARAPKG